MVNYDKCGLGCDNHALRSVSPAVQPWALKHEGRLTKRGSMRICSPQSPDRTACSNTVIHHGQNICSMTSRPVGQWSAYTITPLTVRKTLSSDNDDVPLVTVDLIIFGYLFPSPDHSSLTFRLCSNQNQHCVKNTMQCNVLWQHTAFAYQIHSLGHSG